MTAFPITGPSSATTTIPASDLTFQPFISTARQILLSCGMQPLAITISPILPEEAGELSQLSKESFIDAFLAQNKEEDIMAFVNVAYTPERLTPELLNPDTSLFFARYADSPAAVGYLKVNFGPAQTELQDPEALEVERLYLSSDQTGKGIGQLLLDKALEIARASGMRYVWLGVWEHNVKARKFYARNGFTDFDSHIFTLGDDAQTDIMMKKML